MVNEKNLIQTIFNIRIFFVNCEKILRSWKLKFTDAQKHYIEHINNGEIVDIETFLEILLFDCPSINDETKTFYFELNEKKIEKYFDDDKVIVYFEQIKEFASIIEYLRIKELKSETISIIHNKIICIKFMCTYTI